MPKGYVRTPEIREKMRVAQESYLAEHPHQRAGKRHNEETKAKISVAKSGRRTSLRGENHYGWKGDDAGYMACHNWLRRTYPRLGVCEDCDAKVGTSKGSGTQYAYIGNLERGYERDREKYRQLCVPCHRKFDQARRAT